MAIASFKQFGVWQKAHQMRLAVFDLVDTLPREQGFVLPDQIRQRCIRFLRTSPKDLAESAFRTS